MLRLIFFSLCRLCENSLKHLKNDYTLAYSIEINKEI